MRQHVSIVFVVLGVGAYGCFAPSAEDDEHTGSTSSAVATSNAISDGSMAFHNHTIFGSNGRSCADCHVDRDGFQLRPSTVEARYQALQTARQTDPSADDPLFRPIDADDFRINGSAASDYSNLRQNGLVRITFHLPPTAKLVDPATGQVTSETEVDIWRSVPSVFNVKLTGPDNQAPAWPRGPNTMGGYQLDARIDTLQNQAKSAFFDHAQVTSTPTQTVLDNIAAYENTVFSSDGVKSLSKAIDMGKPLPDIDGPLTDTEIAGKSVFNRSCALCHGGPSTTVPDGTQLPVRYNTILSSCARPTDFVYPPRWQFKACPPRLARNIRVYEITLRDGSVVRRASSDPGRFLLTGVAAPPPPAAAPWDDDWEKFDNAPLRGISQTAPYFSNNSADTLDEVADHYQALFEFVNVVNPTSPLLFTADGQSRRLSDADKVNLVAYLKKL